MSSTTKKGKLIYVVPAWSTFVGHDISILNEHYDVITNHYDWRRKILVPLYMLHQILFLLLNYRGVKAIVISFGGYWSYCASLFGKLFNIPVFIILNGSDAVSFPDINYGNLRKWPLRNVIKRSYQWAHMLLPVSSSLVRTVNTYYSDKAIPLGYAVEFPHINTPYRVVANGLQFSDWQRDHAIERDTRSFFTVLSPNQELRKGIPLILQLARRAPELKFYLGGIDGSDIIDPPENVTCIGRSNVNGLREWYNRCQFYLQLSNFEGFGVALCEAMLCECVPIGSSVNAIPEIIGETGYLLEKRDPIMLEELVRLALAEKNLLIKGQNARQRVLENYSLKKRQKELVSLIESQNDQLYQAKK